MVAVPNLSTQVKEKLKKTNFKKNMSIFLKNEKKEEKMKKNERNEKKGKEMKEMKKN